MENLKSWLERPDNPGSYYELLGCPNFCTDRDRLLAAVRAATRFLHPYENHKTSAIVRRARSLQLLCATAGHTFSDDSKWFAYDNQLKQLLCDEYFAHSPDSDVQKWLRDRHEVDPHRADEIALFIVAQGNSRPRSGPPSNGSDRQNESTDIARDRAADSSTPPRAVPPAIPSPKASRTPPPLPPRHASNGSLNRANAGDPSETAIALNAVTMAVPVQPATVKQVSVVTRPLSVGEAAPKPSTMSGLKTPNAIHQDEHQQSAVLLLPKQHAQGSVIWWLSGIFVAMAVVGIIVLLSLGQAPRKVTPRKQVSQPSNRTPWLIASTGLRRRASIRCNQFAFG